MKINQIIVETSTTAGSVATFSKPLGEVQSRTKVAGLQPAEKVMTGKAKKKGPYANSISEGAVKQLSMDLKGGPDGLNDVEFKKKYGKTKAEVRAEMKKKPEPLKPVNEADLQEDDIIMIPGKGLRVKPGFHKIDPDRAEHEGETLKNSLHTIIRVAKALDRELSVRDNFPEWVSEKIGATKSMIVTVADYLISADEMQHDPDAQLDELSKDTLKSYVKKQPERIKGQQGLARTNPNKAERIVDPKKGDIRRALNKLKDPSYGNAEPSMSEGAKVDRMVKHIEKSERKLGKSKDEAENIAWATANKRGMLDNKNKKKAK